MNTEKNEKAIKEYIQDCKRKFKENKYIEHNTTDTRKWQGQNMKFF